MCSKPENSHLFGKHETTLLQIERWAGEAKGNPESPLKGGFFLFFSPLPFVRSTDSKLIEHYFQFDLKKRFKNGKMCKGPSERAPEGESINNCSSSSARKKEKDGRYEVFEVHKQRSNKQFSGNKGCKSCN